MKQQALRDAGKRVLAHATGWAGQPLAATVRGLSLYVPNPEYERIMELASAAEKRVFSSSFTVPGVGIPVARGRAVSSAKEAAVKRATWRRKVYTTLYSWVRSRSAASTISAADAVERVCGRTGAPQPRAAGGAESITLRAVESVVSDTMSDAFASALRAFLPHGASFASYPDPNHPGADEVLRGAIFECERFAGDRARDAWESAWTDLACAAFCQMYSALPLAARAVLEREASGGQGEAALRKLARVLVERRGAVAGDLARTAGASAAYAFEELLLPLLAGEEGAEPGITRFFSLPTEPLEMDLATFAAGIVSSAPKGRVGFAGAKRADGSVRLRSLSWLGLGNGGGLAGEGSSVGFDNGEPNVRSDELPPGFEEKWENVGNSQ